MSEAAENDALAAVVYNALRPWMTPTTPGRPIAEAVADAILDAGWTRVIPPGGAA